MKKRQIWSGLGQLGMQTIPVIIGVYLGLIPNDFSQNRKEKLRTQSMKERLWYEIDANHKYLENVITYHQFLMDTSTVLLAQPNLDSLQKPTYWKGFMTKRLNESAYQATLLTGTLANFEINELEIISQVYTGQAYYNQFTSQMISNMANINANNTEGLKEILAFINANATDIYYMEKDLINHYTLAKELLNKHKIIKGT